MTAPLPEDLEAVLDAIARGDDAGVEPLADVGSDELVETMLKERAPASRLTEVESDAMAQALFGAPPPPARPPRSPDRARGGSEPRDVPIEAPRRRAIAFASGLVALVAVAIVAGVFVYSGGWGEGTTISTTPHSDERLKGAPAPTDSGGALRPSVHLAVFASSEANVTPRRLPLEGRVAADEAILFRYRLEREAHLVLLARGEEGGVRVLWSSDAARAPTPPEGVELAHGGQALALPPRGYGSTLTLALVASPEPMTALENHFPQDLSKLDAATLAARCPSCGADVISLRLTP